MKNKSSDTNTQKAVNKQSTKPPQQQEDEDIIMDMPEVKDIPGQEHIVAPPLGELADTTASSADEEGAGLLDDLNNPSGEDEIISDNNSNVSAIEKNMLRKSAGHPTNEETENLTNLALDNKDDDGTPLNEKGITEDRSGADLDVPGSELDNDNEDIGEEDEENNIYSGRY